MMLFGILALWVSNTESLMGGSEVLLGFDILYLCWSGAPGPVANRVAVFSAAPQSAAFAADVMDAPPGELHQDIIEPKLEIRTDFPETWLFDLEDLKSNSDTR